MTRFLHIPKYQQIQVIGYLLQGDVEISDCRGFIYRVYLGQLGRSASKWGGNPPADDVWFAWLRYGIPALGAASLFVSLSADCY